MCNQARRLINLTLVHDRVTAAVHCFQTGMCVALAVETVGYLASAIRQSQQWENVTFDSVQKTVLRLVHEGMLQAVNTARGPAMEVRLGAAPQEVEEMLRTRPMHIPLW